MRWRLFAPIVGLLLTCCTPQVSGDRAEKAPAFAPCQTTQDCDEELFCANGGALSSQCALPCDSHTECVTRFGDAYACTDDVCAPLPVLDPIGGSAGGGMVSNPGTRPAACGDGVIATDTGETCDDGNRISGDGCRSDCRKEHGFQCSGAPSVCVGSGLDLRLPISALSPEQAMTLCGWFLPLINNEILGAAGGTVSCSKDGFTHRTYKFSSVSECAAHFSLGLLHDSPWYCAFSSCTSYDDLVCACPKGAPPADAGAGDAGALVKPFESCTVGDFESFFAVWGGDGCSYSFGPRCLHPGWQ